jgi:GLPGLI family protein
MKVKIFLIILFNSLIIVSQDTLNNNQIKVTYEYNDINSSDKFDTYLLINESGSQFIYEREEKIIEGDKYRSTIPFFKYINQLNFKNNLIEENRILDNDIKLYSSWNNNIVWEILDEEKTINGVKVRKATTDSFDVSKDNEYYYGKAIAWFSADLPIPSGPARYYGLPGLIFELRYEKVDISYLLKHIDYNPKREAFVELDKNNLVEKEDVIYFFHKNNDVIKKIKK